MKRTLLLIPADILAVIDARAAAAHVSRAAVVRSILAIVTGVGDAGGVVPPGPPRRAAKVRRSRRGR